MARRRRRRRPPADALTSTPSGTTSTRLSPTAVPDDEEELARVLADAIRAASAELPDGFHFGRRTPDGRFIEVEAAQAGQRRRQAARRRLQQEREGRRPARISLERWKSGAANSPWPWCGRPTSRKTRRGDRRGRSPALPSAGRPAGGGRRRGLAADARLRGVPRDSTAQRPGFAAWQKGARPLGRTRLAAENPRARHAHRPPAAAAAERRARGHADQPAAPDPPPPAAGRCR